MKLNKNPVQFPRLGRDGTLNVVSKILRKRLEMELNTVIALRTKTARDTRNPSVDLTKNKSNKRTFVSNSFLLAEISRNG